MKYPIPNDWNGLDWRCLKIQIPDSQQWTIILNGLLTLLTRGRYWDESTGSIRDIQAIAWEIFSRSYPYVSCEGESDQGGEVPPVIIQNGSVYALIGDGTMGIFLTDIYIDETGKLIKVYGPCCEKPVSQQGESGCTTTPTIPELAQQPVDRVEPADIDPDFVPPAGESAYACIKATGLVQTFADFMISMNTIYNEPLLTSAISAIQDAMPYAALEWDDAWDMYWAYVIPEFVPQQDFDWTTEQTEQAICELAQRLDNTSSAMTEQEFGMFYDSIADQGPGPLRVFYDRIAHSIPKSAYRRAIRLHVFDSVVNCDCPEAPSPDYWTRTFNFGFSHFSPNTVTNYDEDLTGAAPHAGNIIAAYMDVTSFTCTSNGEAKLAEANLTQFVAAGQAVPRKIAMPYSATGKAWLDLYTTGYTQTAIIGDPKDGYADGKITVRISGNNVTVAGAGTLTLVYKTSETPE